MSLGACLGPLEAEGTISPEQAAAARALYDEALARHLRTGSQETAEALASAAALEGLERQVTRKAFLAGRTIKVRNRIEADLRRYGGGAGSQAAAGGSTDGNGPLDPRAGPALIAHDPRAPWSNVEGRRKAILGEFQRQMDGVMAEHHAGMMGQVRNPAGLDDLGREAFGETTGNASARGFAEAWRRTSEGGRQRFNKAGGEIGFRADWGLPMRHDWRKVRAAGFAAWRARIIDRLAIGKMIDTRTGQPFTRESLEAILPQEFEKIRSDGWSDRTPGSPAVSAIANRRADPRFFVFKSYDDWKAYNDEFGVSNVYDIMMGHLQGMARDTAAMEILGPNPDATLKWLKGTLEKAAGEDLAPGAEGVKAARNAGKKIDELWNEYIGANAEPRNERLALVFSGYRALATATKLGSAFLSATSDFAFQQARRSFNGLGRASVIPQYLKLMRPGSIEDQKLAVRRGLIAEEWSRRTAAQSRYLMEELTGRVPKLLAEWVLRASLLARHTQAARWAYGMETLATYTEQAGKRFDELHPKLRGALARYGIDAEGWDKLRSAKMDVDRGVEWISPHNLEDQETAARFMEMIHEETELAVPVAGLRTRAKFNSGLQRGTLRGEFWRSALLFKSFGVSVLIDHVGETLAMQPATAARYAGGLIIGTTLMGALGLQLKAIAAGKDPLPMNDTPFVDDKTGEATINPGFWGAAMAQGGGWGIFGDFVFSATTRTGNGLDQAIAGPVVEDAQSVVDLATAKHPERRVVRTAKKFIPGNNLWYARLAFDRMLADQVEEAANPDYRQSFRRLNHYAEQQGTDFWWAPGDTAPERAPDFANATEGNPKP